MKAFTAMYGIKITDANPEGSSANEISAINELKGKSTAPDVVDVGSSFAVSGDTSGLWAPYKVATWDDIPAAAKATNGDYYADYGGYVAIGYDPSKVKTPPTSFKSLLNPIYKNQVAIDGDPSPDRLRVRRRLRGRARQRRLAVQHRPRRRLLQAAEVGRQLRPDRGHPGDRAVRCHPDPDLVGLPARVRGLARSSRASRSSSRATPSTPATTTRRSARPRPTRPPPGCGRSSSTPPRARTSSSAARPGRSR